MLKIGVCEVCEAAADDLLARMNDHFPGLAAKEYVVRMVAPDGKRWTVALWVDVHAHCEPEEM